MVAADLENCNTLYDFYNNIISNKLYLCRQKLK